MLAHFHNNYSIHKSVCHFEENGSNMVCVSNTVGVQTHSDMHEQMNSHIKSDY